MNKPLPLILLGLLALASPCRLGAEEPEIDADQLLRVVREGMTREEELTLEGRLRVYETGERHPFRMTVRQSQIAFLFEDEPRHTVVLDLGANHFRLREQREGQSGFPDVPADKHGQELRGTGVNYLDISFAYLYWPGAKFLQEDVVAERVTWKVQVTNPEKAGPYARLDLWIDRDTRALPRMQAYDDQGRLVKKMEVKQVQKVKQGDEKVWMLEQMAVSSYDPKTRRRTSLTYLEL